MSNTSVATLKANNSTVSFRDHNGNLEIIPDEELFISANPEQVARMIAIMSAWLAKRIDECQES